jgi:hypothetical protein
MVAELTSKALQGWVAAYERSWRDPQAHSVSALFAPDAEYLVEPYAEPLRGPAAIEAFWAAETGAGEVFTMTSEVVACCGATGVVRVNVVYGDPPTQDYMDLWLVTFDGDGLVTRFEEWRFWPTHGRRGRSARVSTGWQRAPRTASHRTVRTRSTSSPPAPRTSMSTGRRTAVRPGSVAYVPSRVPHRFVDVTRDLEVAVVFAPPESG